MARVEEGGRVRYVSQSANQLEAARDRVAEGAVPGAAAPARRESEIAAAQSRLARLRESAAPQAAIQEVQYDAMLAGANLSEVYQVDQRGAFANDAERANFSQNIQSVVQEGAAKPSVYQQINTALLDQKPRGANQARTTFAASADVDAMSQAWVRADVENKPQAKTAVQNAVRIVHSEGSRVQQAIEAHNKARPGEAVAMDDVVKAAQTNDQAALNKATANMPAVISMDEAKALDKKQRIDRDELLSTFKGRGLERVQNAARRGMATAGRGARAVGRGAAAADGAVAGAAEVATSAGRTRRRMGREFTAVAPDIEAPRAGQPGYRVGPQPPPAPRPAPPPPAPPPAGPAYTGETPEGFETGRHT